MEETREDSWKVPHKTPKATNPTAKPFGAYRCVARGEGLEVISPWATRHWWRRESRGPHRSDGELFAPNHFTQDIFGWTWIQVGHSTGTFWGLVCALLGAYLGPLGTHFIILPLLRGGFQIEALDAEKGYAYVPWQSGSQREVWKYTVYLFDLTGLERFSMAFLWFSRFATILILIWRQIDTAIGAINVDSRRNKWASGRNKKASTKTMMFLLSFVIQESEKGSRK